MTHHGDSSGRALHLDPVDAARPSEACATGCKLQRLWVASNVPVVELVIDENSRQVRQFVCDCCNAEADRTWVNVYGGGAAVAVYYASCYHHNGVHEAWIDAILGTWGHNRFADHVTFGCRVGPVVGSPMPAATLVNGGAAAPDSPIYGHKLSREEGLSHPRLAEFWRLVDTILEHDDLVRHHIYGTGTAVGEWSANQAPAGGQ